MKEESSNKIIITILLAVFVINIVATWSFWSIPQQTIKAEKKTVYDTIPIFYSQPVLVDSAVIKYVEVSLPVSNSDSLRDTVFVAMTDSVKVQIPITQKVYSDSTYKAWVSGFQPALDSICVYQPTKTVTVTQSIIKTETKHWGVGIQAGAGITPSKIEPYIGIGVTYNILSW